MHTPIPTPFHILLPLRLLTPSFAHQNVRLRPQRTVQTLPLALSHNRRLHSPHPPRLPLSLHHLQSQSPITAPPTVHIAGALYEKQLDHSPEPIVSATGARTYVVSEPDPSNTPYEVPSGAFPTSAPYQTYTPTTASVPPGARFASTSNAFAHPLSRAAPQNKSGVMESSAVRYGKAPGEMGARGGGHGGIGLMDAWSTTNGEGELELADRNPPPLGENAEKFSKLGVDNAWKERK